MTWAALMVWVGPVMASTPLTIPTPALYRSPNVVVTLRPGVDLDLNYFGLSLMVRARTVP